MSRFLTLRVCPHFTHPPPSIPPCGITSWSDLVALVCTCLKPFVLVKWTLNPSRSYPSSHRENLRLITRISEPLYSHRHIGRHSCTVWLIWRPWSDSVLLTYSLCTHTEGCFSFRNIFTLYGSQGRKTIYVHVEGFRATVLIGHIYTRGGLYIRLSLIAMIV